MQPTFGPTRTTHWDAVREHLLRRYVPIALQEKLDATYVVVEVSAHAAEPPAIVLVQPREVAGRVRLILIARICAADEVAAEVVLAHGGAASVGGLAVLDGSLALRYVGSLATMTVDELDASLRLLVIEARAFQQLFANHRATVASSAASTMAHWI
jgi:hypothetical protein